MNKYLVLVVVRVEVEGKDLDADAAADYAQSLLVDDGYIVDDVCEPIVFDGEGDEE
jgi:hypothetical protein